MDKKDKSASDVLLELSTANGGIILGGLAGTITVVISKERTANVDWSSGVYDLELTNAGGGTIRLIEGTVEMSKEVTRG